MTAARRRTGYTVLELLVVMAILILFVTIVLPSMEGFFGSNRPKAAADAKVHVVIRGITGHSRVVTGGLEATQQGQRP